MDKRSFIKNLGVMGVGLSAGFSQLRKAVAAVEHISPLDLADDEEFWLKVRGDYQIKPDYINLENGYYCFLPQQTLEHLIEHMRSLNYEGSYYMRTVQFENKNRVASAVAEIVGCNSEEVVITRNTTESLDLIIGGLDWEKGDEAVMAEQDYGAMLNHFNLVEQRYGTVNRLVSVPNHPQSDEELVELYASAITDKTRLLMISHMINITGQVLPVRKIVDMAHERGVEVMVDGAHAYSHIPFKMRDLDCDYYGTSLHKWLSAPLGSGMLYVKKQKIDRIWPLLASRELEPNDIRRLNHIGTHPAHTDWAILNAIEYQNTLGLERKAARLKYLQQYWTSRLQGVPGMIINTPAEQHRHGGIGNIGIEGINPVELADRLMNDHRIYTAAIDRPGVRGIRVTPNVYTTTDELDIFVKALQTIRV